MHTLPSSGAGSKRMIALEVKFNGKPVCIAGAEDLCVLTANINAVGKLGARTVPAERDNDSSPDLFYSVHGLTRRRDPEKDVHLRWTSITPLRLGDSVEVKVVEVEKADRPKSRQKAERRRAKPRRA
jgi:hypothetical protein